MTEPTNTTTNDKPADDVAELTTRQRLERLERIIDERVEVLAGSAITLDAKIGALLEALEQRLDVRIDHATEEARTAARRVDTLLERIERLHSRVAGGGTLEGQPRTLDSRSGKALARRVRK